RDARPSRRRRHRGPCLRRAGGLHLPFRRAFHRRGQGAHGARRDRGAPMSDDTLHRLAATIAARRGADPALSHTAGLLARGPAACAQKFGEEAVEALIEAAGGEREALIREGADVLYHLLVMLAAR